MTPVSEQKLRLSIPEFTVLALGTMILDAGTGQKGCVGGLTGELVVFLGRFESKPKDQDKCQCYDTN